MRCGVSPMLMLFEDVRKQHSVDRVRSDRGRRRATSSAPHEVEGIERRRLYVSVVVEEADLGLHQPCS
jgi:hypothetical protein